MASEVDICNMALALLGDVRITTLSDPNSRAAKLCNQFYAADADAVIRAYPWDCATFRASLAQLATTPAFGFDYEYQLPTDPYCLRVLQMEEKDMVFKIEGGKKLLTDESPAKILYLGRISSGDMDALLTSVLAARVAADIAFGLSNSTSLAAAMWQLYERKLDEAQTIDAQEGSADNIEAETWIDARY
jgi:hypothetical protein